MSSPTWQCPLAAAAAFALAVLLPLAAFAQPKDDRFVQGGSGGLRGGGYPWYDSAKEDLRAIEQPTESTSRQWQGPQFNIGPMFSQIIQVAFVVLLVALLLGLVYLMIRAFLRQERVSEASGELVKVITDETRIEELPFQVGETTGDFLEQARQLYRKGQFNEAIVYLYSHMLLHLDKNRMIRLSKGKTNRQYLVELKKQPALSGLLERTMVSFEDAFFGSHVLQKDDFETCWRELDRFHDSVAEAAS